MNRFSGDSVAVQATNELSVSKELIMADPGPLNASSSLTLDEVRAVLLKGLATQAAELRDVITSRTDSALALANRASSQVDSLTAQLSGFKNTLHALTARLPSLTPESALEKGLAEIRQELAVATMELRPRLDRLESVSKQNHPTTTTLEQKTAGAVPRDSLFPLLLWVLWPLVGSVGVFAAGWYVARSVDKEIVTQKGLEDVLTKKKFVEHHELGPFTTTDEFEKRIAILIEREKQFLTKDNLKNSLSELQGEDQIVLKSDLTKRLQKLLVEPPISRIATDFETILGNGLYFGAMVFPRGSPTDQPVWGLWGRRSDSIDFDIRPLRLTSAKIEPPKSKLWSATEPDGRSFSIEYSGTGGDFAKCVLEFDQENNGQKPRDSSGQHFVIVMQLYGRAAKDWCVIKLQLEPKTASR